MAVTPEDLEREYQRCLRREADRYRERAKSRQGHFETYDILHFDAEAEESKERDHSTSWLSDRGKGAAIIRSCGKNMADLWRRREAAAIKKVRRNASHLLEVFKLILKNGENREKSICELIEIGTPKKK